jgi:hypothetical protein
MARKYSVQIILSLIFIFAPSVMARTWTYYGLGTANVGPYPSLALINGSLPVVSTYNAGAKQLNPLGWISRPDIKGYNFACDGGTTIVSNDAPVKYGKDGKFYSTIPMASLYGSYVGTTLVDGRFVENGVISPTGYPYTGICTADANGEIYVASGPVIGTSSGDSGYIGGSSLGMALDMAVSDFGDIAVSIINGSTTSVCWYDYDKGAWGNRTLGSIPAGSSGKVAVEFDSKGNLGVAYCTGSSVGVLHYAYYDFEQDYWEDEALNASGYGAALAFNQYDLPVIAAGNVLAYDPLPEPVSLLIFGLGVLGIRFRRSFGL